MTRVQAGTRALALLLMLSPLLMQAQHPVVQDPLLDHLAGHWTLRGTIAGKPTVHDVDAAWVMGHHYLRLHEVSTTHNPAGEPDYEATVYIGWQETAAQYGCVWLDTYGGTSPVSLGTGKRAGDAIPFVFHSPEGDFHTTFTFHAANNTWDLRMESETHGSLTPFARATLTRVR